MQQKKIELSILLLQKSTKSINLLQQKIILEFSILQAQKITKLISLYGGK